MKKGTVITIIIVIVIIIAGVVIISRPSTNTSQQQTADNNGDMSTMDMSATTTASTSDQTVATGSATSTTQTFDLTTGSYYFKPNVIHVKKGDTVTMNITNAGGTHNFNIDEFNVKTSIIGSGKTTSVTFVADKTGTFEFYCGIGNHRAMGQKGTLIVE